jgi:asparagine synthase (glutamine-hydrolysing)
MCGIVGLVDFNISSNDILKKNVNLMQSAIFHRGPDSSGSWCDIEDHVGLGHQRLSILDLSNAGHQPMKSSSSRYVIVYNGEIYNHLEIRKNLEKLSHPSISWNGHSDTETLLAAFEYFGIEETLKKTHGMFAMAVWDTKEKVLTLARDRMGEKPLYYGNLGHGFVFSSELKSMRSLPNFENKINPIAIEKYFQYNYIPAPLSIYQDIFKLEPGTFIQYSFKSARAKELLKKEYWSFSALYNKCSKNQFHDLNKACKSLEVELDKAIKSQFISDVPIGVFLSGGIDSSLITSIANKNFQRIKTFTVGFDNKEYDESYFAEEVAKHLNTDHTKLIVTEQDVLEIINQLPKMYDEPFSDSSQLPTYFVCKAAREQVTVALSGDGADELFGGYNRYIVSAEIWKKFSWLPKPIRQICGWSILKVPIQILDSLFNKLIFKNKVRKISVIGSKIHKIGLGLLHADNLLDFCKEFTFSWREAPTVKKSNVINPMESDFDLQSDLEPISQMMAIDSLTYLPDDILCKVDRAAMASSLETRAPFLDHKVIEAALKIPSELKIQQGIGKIPLRKILAKYLPTQLIDRPKAGFAIPIGEWLRGPLKEWAEELLDPRTLNAQGFLDVDIIQNIWEEHLSGKKDFTSKLWAVLMFQSWLKENE